VEQVSTKQVPTQRVLALRHRGPYDAMGAVYHRLHEWARQQPINISGPGFTVFLAPPDEQSWTDAEYEVCLPISGDAATGDGIEVKEIQGTAVAFVQVACPYSEIPARYAELLAWLDVNGLEIAGPPREIYLSRPPADGGGNPMTFLTEIQFPIRSGDA